MILISGGDSWHSRGDQAILAGTIDILQRELGGVDLHALSDLPAVTRHQFPLLHVHSRRNLAHVVRAIDRCDLMIWGGGQLVQNTSSQAFLAFHLAVLHMALRCRKPVVGFALGTAEVRGRLWRKALAGTLDRLDALAVRDPRSLSDLRTFGVRAPIALAADPALLLAPPAMSRAPIPSPYVVLSPRRWYDLKHTLLPLARNAGERPYAAAFLPLVEGWARFADWVVDELGLGVLFVPMYLGPSQADDLLCADIARRMEHGRRASVLSAEAPLPEVMAAFAGARAVVGMRLHALILAACSGVPSLAIYPQEKARTFLAELCLEDFAFAVGDVDWGKIRSSLHTLLETDEARRERVRRALPALLDRARLNGVLVRQVLERGPVPRGRDPRG